jgi:hypothetical protein
MLRCGYAAPFPPSGDIGDRLMDKLSNVRQDLAPPVAQPPYCS